jgi:hypothetical protein
MITRAFVTILLALLGVYAFWSDALGAGHFLNPFGIVFLILAGVFWSRWETIREAFRSVRDGSDIPILRLGSTIIKGMEDHSKHTGRRSTSF